MFLPAEIIRDQRLKRNDIAVACAVWDAVPLERKEPSDPWPFCMLSRRQIEESTDLTKSQVERAFANLARLGYLTTITVDRDTNTYWRKLNVIPAKKEGFGFKKFRTDRSAMVASAVQSVAVEEDAAPYSDDDFKPSGADPVHIPTPEDLSDVVFQDCDFEHVSHVSEEPPDAVVLDASDRFRHVHQQDQASTADVATRIANDDRRRLNAALLDPASERAGVVETVRQCERMDLDPRGDMASTLTMFEFVGHVLAAMVCAHVKGAKRKPHLADGHEATASGLLSRMRHAKVRDHLLAEGREHARRARRGELEGPKEKRHPATGGIASWTPRR